MTDMTLLMYACKSGASGVGDPKAAARVSLICLPTLNSLIKVPVLWKKTYQNLLRYSLFLAVLLEIIQDFYLWYFYFSGTLEQILEDLNWKSIEMSTICFGNGI